MQPEFQSNRALEALGTAPDSAPLEATPSKPQAAGQGMPMYLAGALDLAAPGLGFSPVESIFDAVVASNKLVASPIKIDEYYLKKLIEYSGDNLLDGAVLMGGLLRLPTYYDGGWILDIQKGATAMTLNTSVFVSGSLSIKTYVHEMVHVWQYGQLGVPAFLASYFGLSALTIVKRMINQESLEMMRSSPHEEQAYNLADRFSAWLAANK